MLNTRLDDQIDKAHLIVTNSHATYTIQYRIDESNDPEGATGSWVENTDWTDVAPYGTDPGNAKKHTFNPAPVRIRVQIKDKATNHGTGNAWLKGVGF